MSGTKIPQSHEKGNNLHFEFDETNAYQLLSARGRSKCGAPNFGPD
jgi:hypothetical protein